jgi:hypothetical protein
LILFFGEMKLIPLVFWFYSAAPVTTSAPTVAIKMTKSPNATDVPTISPIATFQPTDPVTKPTVSLAPTNYPSTSVISSTNGTYRQIFAVALTVTVEDQFFNTTDFQIVIEGYTAQLVTDTTVPLSMILTDCTVTQQTLQTDPNSNSTFTAIDYEFNYESHIANVTDLPTQYIAYVNSNLTGFAKDLRAAGLDFISVQEVGGTFIQTLAPTASTRPSQNSNISFSNADEHTYDCSFNGWKFCAGQH